MTFCSSSKVVVFSLLTIDVDLCLNMSEDLNQIYCGRSLDMNLRDRIRSLIRNTFCFLHYEYTNTQKKLLRICYCFLDHCSLLSPDVTFCFRTFFKCALCQYFPTHSIWGYLCG